MKLTQSRLRELLHYDPATGVFRWKIDRLRSGFGSIAERRHGRNGEYRTVYIDGKLYLAHRLAWLYVYGAFPEGIIDHENGVGTDNRISNLRLASHAQNMANSRVRKHSKTGIKGVQHRNGNWRAKITLNRRSIHIGTFPTKELAAAAYAKAARAAHGEFARAA